MCNGTHDNDSEPLWVFTSARLGIHTRIKYFKSLTRAHHVASPLLSTVARLETSIDSLQPCSACRFAALLRGGLTYVRPSEHQPCPATSTRISLVTTHCVSCNHAPVAVRCHIPRNTAFFKSAHTPHLRLQTPPTLFLPRI